MSPPRRVFSRATQLRHLLLSANPNGLFSEQTREIAIDIWSRKHLERADNLVTALRLSSR